MKHDYRLHIQELTDFLKTVIFKVDYFVEFYNSMEKYSDHKVDEDDPKTYIYYRILAGDDTLLINDVKVYSPKVGYEVTLSKASLIEDPTIKEYCINNPSYLTRVKNKYPDDASLIPRILSPLDIDVCIEANNFTILDYESGILQSEEQTSLVDHYQEFLNYVDFRWYVSVYNFENLYTFALLDIIYKISPNVLLEKRILNTRTEKVHDYHLWNYLGSNGYVGDIGHYSRDNDMFLYRNDSYLQRHSGKKFILEILEEEFLLPNKRSLASIKVVNSTSGRVDTTDRLPQIQIGDATNVISISEFNSILLSEGKETKYSEQHINDITEEFNYSPTNELNTKFYEIQGSISSENVSIYDNVLFDALMDGAMRGLFNYEVSFLNPVTNEVVSGVKVIDCINLIIYMLNSRHVDNTNDELFTFFKFDYIPFGKHEELPKYLPHTDIVLKNYANMGVASDVPFYELGVVSSANPHGNYGITSLTEFSSYVNSLVNYHANTNVMVNSCFDSLTYDSTYLVRGTITPKQRLVKDFSNTHVTYDEFFEANPTLRTYVDNLSSDDEILSSVAECIAKVIPYDLDTTTDNVALERVLTLFESLSSYNVAFISTSSGSPLYLSCNENHCMIHTKEVNEEFPINSTVCDNDKNSIKFTDGITERITIVTDTVVEFKTSTSNERIVFEDDSEVSITSNDATDHLLIPYSGGQITYINGENDG